MIITKGIFKPDFHLLYKTNIKHLIILTACLFLLLILFGNASAQEKWPRIAYSKDGTPVSYEVYGTGEPTLIFVHGWSCDSRYWRAQVPEFSKKYRIVLIDLAGHGHSGMSRMTYCLSAFGEDVRAVTETVGGQRVVMIGHSMGGPVVAEAARLMPDRVIGIIGIDNFKNIEYPITTEMEMSLIAHLEKNFKEGCKDV